MELNTLGKAAYSTTGKIVDDANIVAVITECITYV